MTKNEQRIRMAVFPVAGMGTRFLPATKANPKEMLPIVDKPLIQYAAEEAVAAGIETLVFVTGRNKRSIPDHFDKAYELESELEQRGKTRMLELVRNILPPEVTCVYVRQADALGLGHAVGCARPIVQHEPFAVILADDLIESERGGALAQMVEQFNDTQCSVLGVEEVPRQDTGKYGVIDPVATDTPGLWDVKGIVEKPRPEDAPSSMAVVGRYVLTPRIFELLKAQEPGAGGEIQLTDAIARLLEQERVTAFEFSGRRFDCGSKLGYLQATVEFALQHPELSEDFKAYLDARRA
ncbi:UTP--glucose-1-phosphate uridylyltransferase [Thioalkalivibrio nitratireducens DSM 14787]|uniref:UTP--glucose-1-phosphate uridylyltransferase n=1 Tax=Thioalkalivibrio nitratireducens (strain DSM 14787 / UNIQEM 213 / ALEN2) TaxID=1255043 RepID=L0DWT2_THIND|nr:UTP--glucose-1-phosphate uridylyltransferase GalU [Thioalkalivibrio nitratireducens]AGA33462.1 UTP--glucose-1-phosphate uridylyltransferase [Thioalkalivibrio nitratireducens DSM 14787]